eukprot:5904905-Alexandrium_andersonii.AAC.1
MRLMRTHWPSTGAGRRTSVPALRCGRRYSSPGRTPPTFPAFVAEPPVPAPLMAALEILSPPLDTDSQRLQQRRRTESACCTGVPLKAASPSDDPCFQYSRRLSP